MKTSSALPSLLAVTLLVAGCEGSSDEGASSTSTASLCDGTSELRFAATQGGGNLNGVPRVTAELGWGFLVIDGTCRYWALSGATRGVRNGVLTNEEAEQLEDELLLGSWDGLAPGPWSCSDSGGTHFRFGDETYSIACATNELTKAAGEAGTRLYASGSPLDGQVRYTLAKREEPFLPTSIALAWPLALDPESIAVAPGMDEGSNVEPSLADGADAAELRALRDQWNEERPSDPAGDWLRIPIVNETSDGAHYYNLAIRDVTPFEQDNQLNVDAFFPPTN